jgi:hypothetical protein
MTGLSSLLAAESEEDEENSITSCRRPRLAHLLTSNMAGACSRLVAVHAVVLVTVPQQLGSDRAIFSSIIVPRQLA